MQMFQVIPQQLLRFLTDKAFVSRKSGRVFGGGGGGGATDDESSDDGASVLVAQTGEQTSFRRLDHLEQIRRPVAVVEAAQRVDQTLVGLEEVVSEPRLQNLISFCGFRTRSGRDAHDVKGRNIWVGK